MLALASAAAMVLAGLTLVGPARAADPPSAQPRPIPGGIGVVPGTPVGYHVSGPGYSTTNSAALAENSTITDFNGVVGATDVQGTGTATDTRTGQTYPMAFDADMRFMQGRYIGFDGKVHHGTFGFI
jgi:hypothetical protein